MLTCEFENNNWCGYQDISFGSYIWKTHTGESPTHTLFIKGMSQYYGPASDSHFSLLGK